MLRVARILASASRSEENRTRRGAPSKYSNRALLLNPTTALPQPDYTTQFVSRAAAGRRLASGPQWRWVWSRKGLQLGPSVSDTAIGASPLPASVQVGYRGPMPKAGVRSPVSWQKLPPNPSFKRSANGRPPGPRYGVVYHPPRGPGVLPSSPA